MDFETLLTLAIPASFVGLIVLERLRPARPLPKVRFWKAKGLLFFVLTAIVSTVAPTLWLPLVAEHELMNLEWPGLGIGDALVAGVVAFVGTQLFAYGWHRLMHRVGPIWRWFHQMHHSAERLDIYGASYFHPLDMLGFTFVASIVPGLVFGVSAKAALVAGFLGAFYAFFQHTNVRTPRWLGYLIQRPESHSLHHARGVHGYNYADLPLWDLVFGTFRNPASFEAETGFWDGASRRIGPMLIGRDVSRPPAAPIRASVERAAAA